MTKLFITSKLIYLELQKTACTHIASLLKNTVGGEKIGKHNWLTEYKTEKKIVGSIRNPWTWYVSLWAFGCGRKGGLYTRLTKRNYILILKNILKLSFKNAWNEISKPTKLWRSCYESSDEPELFQKWFKLIFDKKRMIDLREGYSDSTVSNFAGFLTFRYSKLHMKNFYKKSISNQILTYEDLVEYDKENNLLDGVIYLENLEEDFIKIVEESGHSLSSELKEELLKKNQEKKNVSKHRGASFYYNEEIKTARKKRGLSREDLGFKIGERTVTISKIENGDLRPSDKTIAKLEKELGITLLEEVKTITPGQTKTGSGMTLGDFIKTED